MSHRNQVNSGTPSTEGEDEISRAQADFKEDDARPLIVPSSLSQPHVALPLHDEARRRLDAEALLLARIGNLQQAQQLARMNPPSHNYLNALVSPNPLLQPPPGGGGIIQHPSALLYGGEIPNVAAGLPYSGILNGLLSNQAAARRDQTNIWMQNMLMQNPTTSSLGFATTFPQTRQAGTLAAAQLQSAHSATPLFQRSSSAPQQVTATLGMGAPQWQPLTRSASVASRRQDGESPARREPVQQMTGEGAKPSAAEGEARTSGVARKPKKGSNQNTKPSKFTSYPLFLDEDETYLTEYQCLLRKQLELFEAGPNDVRSSSQGRNTPILLGQVGLRCRHCARLPIAARTKGAVYYSQTIDGLYQIAQNMSKVHFCDCCYQIPHDIQQKLVALRKKNNRAPSGKEYWSRGVRSMGVYETSDRILRMKASAGEKSDESSSG